MANDPFNAADPRDCLCFNLRRAARVLTKRYDAALKPVGLTAPQFSLLAMLEGRGTLAVSKLGDALGADRTTMTRNVTVLEREALVKVTVGREDRRERNVALTAKGRARLKEARPLWRAAQKRALHALGEDAAGRLVALTRHVATT